jgi:hypothetical protein
LKKVKENVEQSGPEFDDEVRIPCRVLRASRQVSYVSPPAWYGFCRRRTSWYWESEKAGQHLIVSNTPLDHLYIGNPIVLSESSFEPDRLPSSDEIAQLVKSQEYQKRKPKAWDQVELIDKDFYQTWFERHRENEPFDFDKIFMSHSANHANFLDPKFFVKLNGAPAPYSIADTLRVCSSCLEFFNILGGQWKIKYVTPCIGAVMFARLPADRYLEVTDREGR